MSILGPLIVILLSLPGLALWRWLMVAEDWPYLARSIPAPLRLDLLESDEHYNFNLDTRGIA